MQYILSWCYVSFRTSNFEGTQVPTSVIAIVSHNIHLYYEIFHVGMFYV